MSKNQPEAFKSREGKRWETMRYLNVCMLTKYHTAFDFISKKTGYKIDPNTSEKITDGARGLYEKQTGYVFPPSAPLPTPQLEAIPSPSNPGQVRMPLPVHPP